MNLPITFRRAAADVNSLRLRNGTKNAEMAAAPASPLPFVKC